MLKASTAKGTSLSTGGYVERTFAACTCRYVCFFAAARQLLFALNRWQGSPEIVIVGLNHITLAVSDVNISLEFYREVLGFKAHVKWKRGAYLSHADLWICLALDKTVVHQDYTHLAFTVSPADFDAFVRKAEALRLKRWKENHSEGQSLYFLDPDGHKLEVHSGNLASRLTSLKDKPYEEMEWLN